MADLEEGIPGQMSRGKMSPLARHLDFPSGTDALVSENLTVPILGEC